MKFKTLSEDDVKYTRTLDIKKQHQEAHQELLINSINTPCEKCGSMEKIIIEARHLNNEVLVCKDCGNQILSGDKL